ncbi:MAG: CHRD domain-containing protein [Chitinophagaceae bacterium]
MKSFKHLFVGTAICSLALFSACNKDNCQKEDPLVIKKELEISPGQEVPPVPSKAFGKMDVTYDKKSHMLTYSISWSNLTGNPIGSHIHGAGPRGVNRPVRHDFTSLIPKTPSGTFKNSVLVDGVSIKEDSLLKGFYYLNIHTTLFPAGEIRGQIEFK